MSEEATVNSEQSAVISEGEETVVNEKLVPVSEAIRYRRRAQAAEKELSELKELHEKQGEELKKWKSENEKGKREEALRADFDTPSPLRGTPPLQGESLLKEQAESSKTPSLPHASSLAPQTSVKTQGVKEPRTSGARNMLQTAARQAAHSGSRNDVQEYLRIRRNYV